MPYLPHWLPKAAADAIPFFLLSRFSLCGGPPDKINRADIERETKIRTFFLPPLFLRRLRSRLRLRLRLLDRLLVRDRRVRFRCWPLLSRDLDLDRERDHERVLERERERDNDLESDRARPRSQDLDLVSDLDCRP